MEALGVGEMDGGKRVREEDEMRDEMAEGGGAGGGIPIDRDALMAGAANNVLQLAKSSQQKALQDLKANAGDLNVALGQLSGVEYTGGPGDQPFVVILKVLLPRLIGASYRDGMSAEEVIASLEAWSVPSVSAVDCKFLEQFCEAHLEDEFFQPGPHMGGAAENALFEWVDSAITLSTIAN